MCPQNFLRVCCRILQVPVQTSNSTSDVHFWEIAFFLPPSLMGQMCVISLIILYYARFPLLVINPCRSFKVGIGFLVVSPSHPVSMDIQIFVVLCTFQFLMNDLTVLLTIYWKPWKSFYNPVNCCDFTEVWGKLTDYVTLKARFFLRLFKGCHSKGDV